MSEAELYNQELKEAQEGKGVKDIGGDGNEDQV